MTVSFIASASPLADAGALVVNYALRVLWMTAAQLGLLLGPSLLFGVVMQFVGARLMRNSYWNMGRLGYYVTAPGTALHELSHAGFALLFGHRVLEVKLFEIADDHLGYIRHSWDRDSLFQRVGNFFVGTGPVWGCTAAIVGLSLAFLDTERVLGADGIFAPHEADFSSFETTARYAADAFVAGTKLFASMFTLETLKSPWLWLYLYLTFTAGTGFRLSPPDLEGARAGGGLIVTLFLVFNLATAWMGDFSLELVGSLMRYAHGYCALLVFVFILCIFLSLLSHIAFTCISRFRKPKF